MRRPPDCNCRCKPPVNFRVFDFSNGDLLWERLMLESWTIGMDGRVWEMVAHPVMASAVIPYRVGLTSTVTLPSRAASYVGHSSESLYSAVSYDGTSGDVVTESPIFSMYSLSFNSGLTKYTVNSSGLLSRGGGVATVDLMIVDNLTTGPVEYWFQNQNTTTGDIDLKSSPLSSTATFSLTASAAVIESAIQSAFSGLVNSVEVTAVAGTSIHDGMIKVVIDWTLSTSYLGSMAIRNRTQTNALSVINLETGSVGTRGGPSQFSSSYTNQGIWLTESLIFRSSAAPSNSTSPLMECWDSANNPWTLSWSDAYSTGDAVVVPGENLKPISLVAHNSVAVIAMASQGPYPHRSIKRYTTSGPQNEIDHAYFPRQLMLSGDTDEYAAHFLQWDGDEGYINTGGASLMMVSADGGARIQYNTGTGSGSLSSASGFNASSIAAVSIVSLEHPAQQFMADSSGGGIRAGTGTQPSGLSDPFAPAWAYVSYWLFASPIDMLVSTCQWRLAFRNTGVYYSSWFDEDATLADVNTELLAMFGSDIDDRQNVVADEWNTVPVYKSQMVPMVWQREMRITARCARNAPEAAASGMDLLLSASVPAAIVRIRVQVQNYISRRTASVASLSRTDGSEIWSRGFSANQPDSPCGGVLHDSLLYCMTPPGVTYRGEL